MLDDEVKEFDAIWGPVIYLRRSAFQSISWTSWLGEMPRSGSALLPRQGDFRQRPLTGVHGAAGHQRCSSASRYCSTASRNIS